MGVGVQAPQLILQFKEGVQWFYYTFSRGGRGPTFSRGGGRSAHGHCGILARIG